MPSPRALPFELKPAYHVADLLEQHILDLEGEADAKGGIEQALLDHFAKIYKVWVPAGLLRNGGA